MGVLTLDAIRREAAPDIYPRHLLVGCESALVLFAAAFHGQQDAVWMAEAGLRTTCVDIDGGRLEEMWDAYPDGWEFVEADVFEFATRVDRQWDVVSIDCPSNLFDRCAELLPLWCLLARKAVVLGRGRKFTATPPDGWAYQDSVYRSTFRGGVYWAVFQPCV